MCEVAIVRRCTAAGPKLLHLLINRVHTGGTAVCNSNRSISIRNQCHQIIVAIACSLTAPFYHLKRRLCSGLSNVCILQGWIGNSRVTCSGCSLDRLAISMLCRPLCRQVTFLEILRDISDPLGSSFAGYLSKPAKHRFFSFLRASTEAVMLSTYCKRDRAAWSRRGMRLRCDQLMARTDACFARCSSPARRRENAQPTRRPARRSS